MKIQFIPLLFLFFNFTAFSQTSRFQEKEFLTLGDKHPITWDADGKVCLQAADFSLYTNGEHFHAQYEINHIDSNNGNTLEAYWTENSVEMRLYVYLKLNGGDWEVEKIRTYNGLEDGDWLEYIPLGLKAKLNEPIQKDKLTLNGIPLGNKTLGTGTLIFENFVLTIGPCPLTA